MVGGNRNMFVRKGGASQKRLGTTGLGEAYVVFRHLQRLWGVPIWNYKYPWKRSLKRQTPRFLDKVQLIPQYLRLKLQKNNIWRRDFQTHNKNVVRRTAKTVRAFQHELHFNRLKENVRKTVITMGQKHITN